MIAKSVGWIAAAALSTVLCTPMIGTAQKAAQPTLLTGLEHVSLWLPKGQEQAEFQFFDKLGFEEALLDNEERNDPSASWRVTTAYLKVNDGQFILAWEPSWGGPTFTDGSEVQPGTAKKELSGVFHFAYSSPNLSALYGRWTEAGLKPTQVHRGEGGVLELEIVTPEIFTHNFDGDHLEAVEYVTHARTPAELCQQVQDRGKHLGAKRISDKLFGVEMPVENVPLWQRYFEEQGFVASSVGTKVQLTVPGTPASDMQIVLRPAKNNEKYYNASLLFSVKDVKEAEKRLRSAGLEVETGEHQVTVHDAGGIPFVFVEM